MRRPTRPRTASVLTIATLGMLISRPGHAYLDPGTGSIILQGLLAGLAVAIGLVRGYWQQFKAFFGKLSGKSGDKKNHGDPDLEQTSDVQSN